MAATLTFQDWRPDLPHLTVFVQPVKECDTAADLCKQY